MAVDETSFFIEIESHGQGFQFRGDFLHAGAIMRFPGHRESLVMRFMEQAILSFWRSETANEGKDFVNREPIFDDLCLIPNLSLISNLRVMTNQLGSSYYSMPHSTVQCKFDNKEKDDEENNQGAKDEEEEDHEVSEDEEEEEEE
jgi:hypothetical protein